MNSQVQKWYDKPISKIILVSISLTWVLPYFGFVLSSFRPGDSIKRVSWWSSIATGDFIREFTFENYSEILFAENLSRSFFNSFAVTIPSTIIPITIAAFAAYAFAFIDFKGKDIAFLFVVAMITLIMNMEKLIMINDHWFIKNENSSSNVSFCNLCLNLNI